jgi:hypothetical protein
MLYVKATLISVRSTQVTTSCTYTLLPPLVKRAVISDTPSSTAQCKLNRTASGNVLTVLSAIHFVTSHHYYHCVFTHALSSAFLQCYTHTLLTLLLLLTTADIRLWEQAGRPEPLCLVMYDPVGMLLGAMTIEKIMRADHTGKSLLCS